MKKKSLVLTSILAAAIFSQPSEVRGQPTNGLSVNALLDDEAFAGFQSFDPTGCIETDVAIQGTFFLDVATGQLVVTDEQASMSIAVFNNCTGIMLLNAQGFSVWQKLVFDPKLRKATLTALISLNDVNGFNFSAFARIEWYHAGPITGTTDTSVPGTVTVYSSAACQATGVVSVAQSSAYGFIPNCIARAPALVGQTFLTKTTSISVANLGSASAGRVLLPQAIYASHQSVEIDQVPSSAFGAANCDFTNVVVQATIDAQKESDSTHAVSSPLDYVGVGMGVCPDPEWYLGENGTSTNQLLIISPDLKSAHLVDLVPELGVGRNFTVDLRWQATAHPGVTADTFQATVSGYDVNWVTLVASVDAVVTGKVLDGAASYFSPPSLPGSIRRLDSVVLVTKH